MKHSHTCDVKLCICVVVYLSDVPQGVQQCLSVSFHHLHVSLIVVTLLLKENIRKNRHLSHFEEED